MAAVDPRADVDPRAEVASTPGSVGHGVRFRAGQYLAPVSYTHLDVYKRQLPGRSDGVLPTFDLRGRSGPLLVDFGERDSESRGSGVQPVPRQDAGAAGGGADAMVGGVEVDPDAVAWAEIAGMLGGLEGLAGPAPGGEVEAREAIDLQSVSVLVGEGLSLIHI